MKSVVIAGYARSPFCPATKGELAKVRTDDLAASVIRALIDRTKVNAEDIEDLILGCAFPEGEQGLNVARLIGFIAKLPLSVAGVTVNRFCGSSMQSVHMAAGAIQMGAGDVFICAGVESMSRVPMMGYNPLPNPELAAAYPQAYVSMGITAENVAKKYKLLRKDQEGLAVQSHAKAAAAQQAGKFKDEIIPYKTPDGLVDKDGCIRPGTTLAKLAELKPAFDEKGVVTAGTSSPLTDGASAVLVASEDYARANNLPIMARIKSIAVAGCAPEIMGIGPVGASNKALKRAGLSIKQIDIVELNEAFASQALACIWDLGIDPNKVNLDGGAIALGHPLGATGARIVGKAASLLVREGKQFALATQCIGGGQGIATILEAVR
jgi:acetyl-CoA acyltransferase